MLPRNSLAPLVFLLLPWSILTEPDNTSSFIIGPGRLCNDFGENRIKARFGGDFHWLCLRKIKTDSSPLLARKSVLYVGKTKQDLDSANIYLWQGYTIGLTTGGNADGYLSKDGQFVGSLVFEDRIIYTRTYDDQNLVKMLGFDNDPENISSRKVLGQKRTKRGATLLQEEATKYDNMALATNASWNTKTEQPPLPPLPPSRTRARDRSSTSPYFEEEETTTRREQKSSSALPIYEYRFKPKTKKKKPPIPGHIVAPTPATQEPARARLCELLVLADHTFYLNDVKSSRELALKRILHAVYVADMVFRNTDFDDDGTPDNIGFALKYVMVITTPEADKSLFGNLPPNRELDGADYLMRFAALTKLRDVCLGIAFTGRKFKNSTMGYSFSSSSATPGGSTGGVCRRDEAGLSFNVLAVAHGGIGATLSGGKSKRLSVRLAEAALLHELGHSFGATHDEQFNRRSCRDYIMSRSPGYGKIPTNMEFSPCSRDSIRQSIAAGISCLVQDERAYCGNGIVEGNEDCDCGPASRCATTDHCCTPRVGTFGIVEERSVHVGGCLVSPNALCHPSQGGCCDRHCHFVDLSAEGIDCSRMQEKCPCDDNVERCSCGLGGECLPDGTCVAVECARLGLQECICPYHGPGGAVGDAHRCGVCCLVPAMSAVSEPMCSGAETAAIRMLLSGHTMLEDLRDEDFTGPSVFFRLCKTSVQEECDYVSLRAWYKRGACSALGRLGVCSPRGVCVPPLHPAPNLYPLPLYTPIDAAAKRRSELTGLKNQAGNKFQSGAIFLVYFNIFCQNIL